jgi:hypothetical protein
MARKKPLVLDSNGGIQQLQAGDYISEVDFLSQTNGEVGAIVIGAPVYKTSTANEVKKARANASGTSNAIGLAADVTVAAGASANIQTDGVLTATTGQWDTITGGSGGLTPGSKYFLDDATAGKLTATAPTSTSSYVQEVGIALSTTDMLIRPRYSILL